MRFWSRANDSGMIDPIIIASGNLISVVQKAIPLRTTLGVQGYLVIMRQFSGYRCIVDDLVLKPSTAKGRLSNFMIGPIKLKSPTILYAARSRNFCGKSQVV